MLCVKIRRLQCAIRRLPSTSDRQALKLDRIEGIGLAPGVNQVAGGKVEIDKQLVDIHLR
jgi:hypothetical protein